MERLKDQKADQKRLSPGTSFGDRSCSDFGFVEAALKCRSFNRAVVTAQPSCKCDARSKDWKVNLQARRANSKTEANLQTDVGVRVNIDGKRRH